MQVIKSEYVKTDDTNKDWWRVIIVSDSTPDSFELDGSDVDGMADDAGIAAGSVLLTPSANYVAYVDGTFGGGGGGGNITVRVVTDGSFEYGILAAATLEELDTVAPIIVNEQTYTMTISDGYYIDFTNSVVDSYTGDVEYDAENNCYVVSGDCEFELRAQH